MIFVFFYGGGDDLLGLVLLWGGKGFSWEEGLLEILRRGKMSFVSCNCWGVWEVVFVVR